MPFPDAPPGVVSSVLWALAVHENLRRLDFDSADVFCEIGWASLDISLRIGGKAEPIAWEIPLPPKLRAGWDAQVFVEQWPAAVAWYNTTPFPAVQALWDWSQAYINATDFVTSLADKGLMPWAAHPGGARLPVVAEA